MPTKFQDIKRASKVVKVLWNHGFGRIIYEYGLQSHLPFLKKFAQSEKRLPEDVPAKLRMVLEELGGAYIKLGQLLSIRPDLIPQEFCNEFKKLQDSIEPLPFEKMKIIIEQCLEECFGKKLGDVYSYIDPVAVGSASIAQVYKAKLKNKKDVVIKVQRPFVREQFEEDIDIMHYIAKKIAPKFNDSVSPVQIVEEFEKYTKKELDFFNESKNIDKFFHAFENERDVVIPHVYWQYSGKNILTMEYICGKKLSEVGAYIDKKEIAQIIVDSIIKQVYKNGIFHADLHPGNILVLNSKKIALLDFGIVGILSQDLRRKSLEMFVDLINNNCSHLCKTILEIGVASEDTDAVAFKNEVEAVVNDWYENGKNTYLISHTLYKIVNISIKHRIKLPVDIILYAKSFVTAEGTCIYLVPGFNFVEASTPLMIELMKKENTPRAIIERFIRKTKLISEAVSEIPQGARDLIEKIKSGRITFDLKDTDIKHLGMDINLSSNRLSFSIITASLVVAGALFINVSPKIAGYSLFSIAFLFVAFVLLCAMLVSIFREGREKFDFHRKI